MNGEGQKRDFRNTGYLYKNDKKPPGSKQPDYSGPFTDANGEEMQIAAWIQEVEKEGEKPRKRLWIKISPPYQRSA